MNNRVELTKSNGPFWRWTLNFAVGRCPGECLYCYNKRWPWSQEDFRVKDDLTKLDAQCELFQWKPGDCKQYNGQWDIMMSSSHDPLCPVVQAMADKIMKTLFCWPEVWNHLRVLSKFWGQGFQAAILAVANGPLYGATITTLDNDMARRLQPNATIPSWEGAFVKKTNIMDTLLDMQDLDGGRNVWISSEPMFRGMNLYKTAEYLEEGGCTPVEWWVGRLNHENIVPEVCREAALPDAEIMRQFLEVTESFPGTDWRLKAEVVI